MLLKQLELEAEIGIEPTDEAFAEPCLTTWLPRHHRNNIVVLFGRRIKFKFLAVLAQGVRQNLFRHRVKEGRFVWRGG